MCLQRKWDIQNRRESNPTRNTVMQVLLEGKVQGASEDGELNKKPGLRKGGVDIRNVHVVRNEEDFAQTTGKKMPCVCRKGTKLAGS